MPVIIEFPDVEAVHVIPSDEYASLFVPVPPAIHKEPFHATDKHCVVKIELPFAEAVQLIPSYEYAS